MKRNPGQNPGNPSFEKEGFPNLPQKALAILAAPRAARRDGGHAVAIKSVAWASQTVLLAKSAAIAAVLGAALCGAAHATRVVDRNNVEWLMDDESGAGRTIDTVHANVHDGIVYTAVATSTIGAPVYYYFYSPYLSAATDTHFIVEGQADAGCAMMLLEGGAVSASGATLTAFNNFRDSTRTYGAQLFASPTVTAEGTPIDYALLGSGAGGRVMGAVRSHAEWVLKKGTRYLLKLIPGGAGVNTAVRIQFYEE